MEDQATVREAIAAEFERDPDFELVGQAASLGEARVMLTRSDIAIIDLGLPDGSGADLITELRAANPQAQAIVLSASFDRHLHGRALDLGAVAVLDKSQHLGQVAQAVRRIVAAEGTDAIL